MNKKIESLAAVPAAQPADEIADLTKRLAAAQRPFDPDVAEVIRKGWDTLFDDAQPAPDAGEPVYQVRFREHGMAWLEVDREMYEHGEAYLPSHWERRTLYRHPASAASEAADAQLADTQRAIIEAAEARGYARAKTEGEAEARELVRIPWTYNYWSEGVFGSPTNAANIVAYNGEDVAAIAYVPDAGERARIIEKHNNIVRRIEALAAQQRKGG